MILSFQQNKLRTFIENFRDFANVRFNANGSPQGAVRKVGVSVVVTNIRGGLRGTRQPDNVKNFLEKLVNWEAVAARL